MFERKTELTMCALYISLLLAWQRRAPVIGWQNVVSYVQRSGGERWRQEGGHATRNHAAGRGRQRQPACGAISCLHRFQLVSVARSHGLPTASNEKINGTWPSFLRFVNWEGQRGAKMGAM